MAGRWMITDHNVVPQKITDISTTQKLPLGTIVRAEYTGYASGSVNYGAGEFIYLKGIGDTVVGSLVQYDPSTGNTELTPNETNTGAPLAVAMGANVADRYGWYQVAGVAVIKKTAVKVAPGAVIFLSGTAGRVKASAAAGSGKQIIGARAAQFTGTVTTVTSTVMCVISRPHVVGQSDPTPGPQV